MKYISHLCSNLIDYYYFGLAAIACYLGYRLIEYWHDPVVGPNMRRKFGDDWLTKAESTLKLIEAERERRKQLQNERRNKE